MRLGCLRYIFSHTLLDASWMLTLHFFPHSSGCVLDAYATFFPHSSGCVLGNATLQFFSNSSLTLLHAYATFFPTLFSHSSSCLRFNFFSTHKYINLWFVSQPNFKLFQLSIFIHFKNFFKIFFSFLFFFYKFIFFFFLTISYFLTFLHISTFHNNLLFITTIRIWFIQK